MPVSERRVPIGEIVATHGLGGWLKLTPFNPATTALDSARRVYLEGKGGVSILDVEAHRTHRQQILIKLHGVDDIDGAKRWIGTTLAVPEASLPPLEPGQYYYFQAVGLQVFDSRGNRLGVITQTCTAGAGQVYVVAGEHREYLIPAVKEIVEKVDFDAGTMVIDPPDGLLDL